MKAKKPNTSLGGTGLSATKTRLRDSTVDDFYKQVGHEPFIKDEKSILDVIKDGERIKL